MLQFTNYTQSKYVLKFLYGTTGTTGNTLCKRSFDIINQKHNVSIVHDTLVYL